MASHQINDLFGFISWDFKIRVTGERAHSSSNDRGEKRDGELRFKSDRSFDARNHFVTESRIPCQVIMLLELSVLIMSAVIERSCMDINPRFDFCVCSER